LIFHDLLGVLVEVHMDDLVIKSASFEWLLADFVYHYITHALNCVVIY
jgi:hypothetical protein